MNNTKNLNNHVKPYILDHIDPEPYTDEAIETDHDKLLFLYDCFKNEYGHEIIRQRGNEQAAFREWLMGLPTIFTVDFENYKILQLAVAWNSIPENYTEKQADKILNNWFNLVSAKTFQMLRKEKIIN